MNCGPSIASARYTVFNAFSCKAAERTVRVQFDASRMKEDAVARLLRQAGLDVQEKLILA